MELLTLAEIGRRLDLPASTVRYYRDRYKDFIPTVGEGRRRRYRPEAVAVLQVVAECMERNMNAIETTERLSHMFPVTVDVGDQKERKTASTNATKQPNNSATAQHINNARPQPDKNTLSIPLPFFMALFKAQQETTERVAAALERVADRLEETQELKAEVAALREEWEALARDKELVAQLREKTKKPPKRRWWQFFNK